MSPYLVSAPVLDPVDLPALKLHCEADDFTDDDNVLLSLRDAAVAWLDGWSGVLGRAIMPQTWALEATAAGTILLPMPDVTSASVDYGDGAVEIAVGRSAAGLVVEIADAGVVSYECALPASKLPAAQLIIKMLVRHWYDNRGAVSAGSGMGEIPISAEALIQSLRWRLV